MGRRKKAKFKINQKIKEGKICYIKYENQQWRYYLETHKNPLFDKWWNENELVN